MDGWNGWLGCCVCVGPQVGADIDAAVAAREEHHERHISEIQYAKELEITAIRQQCSEELQHARQTFEAHLSTLQQERDQSTQHKERLAAELTEQSDLVQSLSRQLESLKHEKAGAEKRCRETEKQQDQLEVVNQRLQQQLDLVTQSSDSLCRGSALNPTTIAVYEEALSGLQQQLRRAGKAADSTEMIH